MWKPLCERVEDGWVKCLARANLFGKTNNRDGEERKERFWSLDWWDFDEDETGERREWLLNLIDYALVLVLFASLDWVRILSLHHQFLQWGVCFAKREKVRGCGGIFGKKEEKRVADLHMRV